MPDRKFVVNLTLLVKPENEEDLREKALEDCSIETATERDEQGEYTMPLADLVRAIVESIVWSNVEYDHLPLRCDEDGDPVATVTEG